MARVAAAERACRAGELHKVVLARSVTFELPVGHVFSHAGTIAALRGANPDAVVFGVGDGRGRLFAGATPELLLRAHGGRLSTHALAGTRPSAPDVQGQQQQVAALLASDKERREHALVVERIAAALDPYCDAVVSAPTPRARVLPNLLHLETPIDALLRPGFTWRQVVDALHPTPAVCGEPRQAAMAWLRSNEALQRGGFSGHVGWLDAAGDGACAVALRCVLLQGRCATVYAGAGIVAASEPAAEWEETELKLQTAMDALRWEVSNAH